MNSSNTETESDYRDRIQQLHHELGVPENYEIECGIPLQSECETLEDAGVDVFGRPALLERDTLNAWNLMMASAATDDITLFMVSAWRSALYQRDLVQRKLDRGERIEDILRVNAAPGYSEHHTGRAVDVGTTGVEHLSEAFEDSKAFTWLTRHAASFGFSLSFPRDNPSGIQYEPWHWKYTGSRKD